MQTREDLWLMCGVGLYVVGRRGLCSFLSAPGEPNSYIKFLPVVVNLRIGDLCGQVPQVIKMYMKKCFPASLCRIIFK